MPVASEIGLCLDSETAALVEQTLPILSQSERTASMPEAKVSRQKFSGNIPTGDVWELLELTEEIDGTKRGVSVKRADHPWKTVKVFATNTVVTKANYWLSSNGIRFAKGRDYVIMETNRPELIDAVAKVCDDRIA